MVGTAHKCARFAKILHRNGEQVESGDSTVFDIGEARLSAMDGHGAVTCAQPIALLFPGSAYHKPGLSICLGVPFWLFSIDTSRPHPMVNG